MADEPTEQGTGPDEGAQPGGADDIADTPAQPGGAGEIEHTSASAPEPAAPPVVPDASSQEQAVPEAPPARKSAEARKAALAQAIQTEVVQGGRIESQADFQAVFVFGKPVNHILHLILSVVTCGIWLIVWLGMLIWGGENRVMVSIDEYGNVLRQKIK